MQRMRRRRRKNQAGGAERVRVLRTAREVYFFQRHLGKFQFRTKLKSGKWKYAKNANEKKEKLSGRSREGRSLENWSWAKNGLGQKTVLYVCLFVRFFIF
jgi:hypothetical protein